jgi:hypothetical protein
MVALVRSAAEDVQLTEHQFIDEHFELIHGIPAIKFDRIAANASADHVLVVRPRSHGVFNATAATVTYKASHDAEPTIAYSSFPTEQVYVLEANVFNRYFLPHYLEWIVFIVLSAAMTGLPYHHFTKAGKSAKKRA